MLEILKICYPIGILLSYAHFRYISYSILMTEEFNDEQELKHIIFTSNIQDTMSSLIWPISTLRCFADKIAFNLAKKNNKKID